MSCRWLAKSSELRATPEAWGAFPQVSPGGELAQGGNASPWEGCYRRGL